MIKAITATDAKKLKLHKKIAIEFISNTSDGIITGQAYPIVKRKGEPLAVHAKGSKKALFYTLDIQGDNFMQDFTEILVDAKINKDMFYINNSGQGYYFTSK